MKISVLVPTIGEREREIRRLFDSIIDQRYENVEVVLVVQNNFEEMENLCLSYKNRLNVLYIATKEKGISKARNLGLKELSGDIILLSDDDCWYPKGAFESIINSFKKNPKIDIFLSQIFDPEKGELYKNYSTIRKEIIGRFDLLSRSSIEIAFRNTRPIFTFDEAFGLGAKYVAGEENDFLLRSLKAKKRIMYNPVVTVFHEKKSGSETKSQLVAKGAFYAKNFGFIFSNLVLLRDLFLKHQNNFRGFYNGFFDYKRNN